MIIPVLWTWHCAHKNQHFGMINIEKYLCIVIFDDVKVQQCTIIDIATLTNKLCNIYLNDKPCIICALRRRLSVHVSRQTESKQDKYKQITSH